jgi:hypothetical protein
LYVNRISGIMVSVLPSSVVDCGFEPQSGQTKDYKIGMCYIFAKNKVLQNKSKSGLAWNQDHVSEWNDMSTIDCCFSDLLIQLSILA